MATCSSQFMKAASHAVGFIYPKTQINLKAMLSIFGLTFIAVYAILKWRYILPSVYGKEVNWSVWPYSISAGFIALCQLLFSFPSVSVVSSYTQLLLAVVAVAAPSSGAWKCCIVSVFLSALHIFRNGETPHIVVATIVLLLVFKYFHHSQPYLPG